MTEIFGGRVRLLPGKTISDPRGSLFPFEFSTLPFMPRRAFAVTDVPAGTVRGGHAHRYGMQLLYCVQGRIEVIMRVADEIRQIELTPEAGGLLVGKGVWSQQKYLVEGSVLLVFASEPYDPSSYVEHWGDAE